MPAEGQLPLFSVIIPARNEEENIAACVRSLLAQGKGIEIIVADDNSDDATATIVREIAASTESVKLIPVPPLPEGWTGKNHALYHGAKHARGEWLLFTDADTRHIPGALRGVMERAERERLDMISLSPPQQMETWWESAVLPMIFLRLARLYPFERVNDPNDPLAAANGQFILIRRRAYENMGGHEAVRSELLEDVALAQRVKHEGFRIWFGPGDGILTTRMYRTFFAMWEGWTKNLFLLCGRSRAAVLREAAALALRGWLPPSAGVVLLCAGLPLVWAGIALLTYSALEHARYAHELRPMHQHRAAMLLIPGSVVLFLLLLNSERRYSRQLGVTWRGRRYSAPA